MSFILIIFFYLCTTYRLTKLNSIRDLQENSMLMWPEKCEKNKNRLQKGESNKKKQKRYNCLFNLKNAICYWKTWFIEKCAKLFIVGRKITCSKTSLKIAEAIQNDNTQIKSEYKTIKWERHKYISIFCLVISKKLWY